MVFHRPRGYIDHRSQGDGLFMTDASFSRTFEKFDAEGLPLNASGRDGIWLLDDDFSMLKALGRLLNSAGFAVEKFSNPADFLSELEQRECRVAVLDVWMPDMNGLEVQACLRLYSPKTRIIFITGRDDPSVRQAALDAGAFAFLAKPFEDEVLVQLIHKAVTG
jgi:FixJ family two-component response regulator